MKQDAKKRIACVSEIDSGAFCASAVWLLDSNSSIGSYHDEFAQLFKKCLAGGSMIWLDSNRDRWFIWPYAAAFFHRKKAGKIWGIRWGAKKSEAEKITDKFPF